MPLNTARARATHNTRFERCILAQRALTFHVELEHLHQVISATRAYLRLRSGAWLSTTSPTNLFASARRLFWTHRQHGASGHHLKASTSSPYRGFFS